MDEYTRSNCRTRAKDPAQLKFVKSRLERGITPRRPSPGKTNYYAYTLRYTTGVLTTAVLIYALGAGITAGAGTRLVLQLLLDVGWL